MSYAIDTIDRELTAAAVSLDFLMTVTPVNSAEAFEEFERSGWKREPVFQYRTPTIDTQAALDRLADLPLMDIEDASVRELFHGKRDELALQIKMIEAIDTPRFYQSSLELYGGVDDNLYESAVHLLDELPRPSPSEPRVEPHEMARRARTEIDLYCKAHPDLSCSVQVRDDVVDLMVSRGNFFIGAASNVRAERVEPLIQHEIGTHVVTYYNACFQPFSILRVGLAGYEETQEGIALLAEHLVDGLDAERMHILAARVVAVRRLLDGMAFIDIFDELRSRGLAERSAWSVVSRVARAGGFTKDAMYLRGLVHVVNYLRDGGSMTPLLVGKIALDHVPAIEQLIDSGVLKEGPLIPHWLQLDDIEERLEKVAAMEGPIGLVTREVAA